MADQRTARVVQVDRGVERAESPGPERGPQHEALQPWIGRWINQGHTIDDDGSPGLTITTSDVYEWAPGGFFVLHERTDDGTNYKPSMKVTLVKVY
jgi:hypothetical protein